MGKRTWWPTDDDELRRLYSELADAGRLSEVGPRMGRTVTSARKRAAILGITDSAHRGGRKGELSKHWTGGREAANERQKAKQAAERLARGAPKQHPWSKAEDARLAELCTQMSLRDAAEIMGRTLGSVRRRMQVLGLKGRPVGAWQQRGPGNHNWKGGSSASHRRSKYQLEPAEYASLLESQDGRCAICRNDASLTYRGFHIDHDHETGKARGILCSHCNLMLGHAKDDESVLRRAADYLARYRDADVACRDSVPVTAILEVPRRVPGVRNAAA